MTEYLIRTMTRPELDIALDWAEQEGWRPGLADADYFYQADPEGFFIGLLNGEPVGCISGVKYGDNFGFLGLYIVRPEWRNQGFGMQLWQTAMHYLQGRNIGLDGVIAQQTNYQKSGFHSAYRHVRYQGTTGGFNALADEVILLASAIPFNEILAYDNALFPASRPVFLKAWLNHRHGTALALIRQSRFAGYGLIRACQSGFRIGPLFADSRPDAETLLNALLARVPEGSAFFIDVPEPNQQAMALVAGRNMQPVFETARMYTREIPAIALDKCFAVTTLELG